MKFTILAVPQPKILFISEPWWLIFLKNLNYLPKNSYLLPCFLFEKKKKNIWKMKEFRTKPTHQNKSHYHNFIFSKNSKILVLTVTCICQKWTDIWDLSEFWNVTFIVFEKKQISTKELKSLTTYLLVLHRRFFKKNMYDLNSLQIFIIVRFIKFTELTWMIWGNWK